MIKSKILQKTKIVNHGFFNKKNGFSRGIYKSLNCGKGSNDNKKNIRKNLTHVKKKYILIKITLYFYTKFIVQNFFSLKNSQKGKLLETL